MGRLDPELAAEMAAAIGASMRAAWPSTRASRRFSTSSRRPLGQVGGGISEDPYLVGTLATAYVSAVLARDGHHPQALRGYSLAGRAQPRPIGPREFADVLLQPFVMALRDVAAR